jgi:tRNA threonylcarbamoyladenosine biosynthesis protein TsaB
MKVLVIDTSSMAASTAIFEDQTLIKECFLNTKETHSQKIMPLVDAVMVQTQTKVSDIDAYYVCEGPGSFTGVRIGIATAKGLAQPFGKPIYGFSSMFLIASGFKGVDGLIIPMIDAKRMDVYYGVYEWQGDTLATLEEGVAPLETLLEALQDKYPNQKLTIAGDALTAYPAVFESPKILGESTSLILAIEADSSPRAGNIAISSVVTPDSASVHTIRANYMRKSQAERDQSHA